MKRKEKREHQIRCQIVCCPASCSIFLTTTEVYFPVFPVRTLAKSDDPVSGSLVGFSASKARAHLVPFRSTFLGVTSCNRKISHVCTLIQGSIPHKLQFLALLYSSELVFAHTTRKLSYFLKLNAPRVQMQAGPSSWSKTPLQGCAKLGARIQAFTCVPEVTVVFRIWEPVLFPGKGRADEIWNAVVPLVPGLGGPMLALMAPIRIASKGSSIIMSKPLCNWNKVPFPS